MDATRRRRCRDSARQRWYARCRCFRLARFLGFTGSPAVADRRPPERGTDSPAATPLN